MLLDIIPADPHSDTPSRIPSDIDILARAKSMAFFKSRSSCWRYIKPFRDLIGDSAAFVANEAGT